MLTPVIYGGVDSKKYIMEADGCGFVFIDYDNDGWMDIFQYPEAAVQCRKALEIDPKDQTALYHLIQGLRKADRKGEIQSC